MSHQRGGANGLSKPLSSFSRALVFPEPFTICICYFSYVHLHSNLTLLWLPLAPFCPPLCSVWPPLVPLWLPFGSHGAPFWLPSALLGTKPLHYTTARDTAGLWPMNLLIYKAHFFLCTRLFLSPQACLCLSSSPSHSRYASAMVLMYTSRIRRCIFNFSKESTSS